MPIYRLYYNRSHDWPQVCSIDHGDQSTEWNVQDAVMDGCLVRTRRLPPPIRSAEGVASVTPTFWVEIDAADVTMVNGVAVFLPRIR